MLIPGEGARAWPHASTTDVARKNAHRYRYPRLPVFPAEARILSDLLTPGMCVLDLGCGDGRISRALLTRGVRVCACDLSYAALEQFRSSPGGEGLIGIGQADARSLPFADASMDAVIFAFNGLDFIHPESGRITALCEIGRLLRPGGYFVLSAHNPLGSLLSPRGIRSYRAWRWRLDYAFSGSVGRPYFENSDGLQLYHALPRRVVAQVREHTRATFLYCLNRSGTSRSMALVTVFSAWPYYVFRRSDDRAGS